MAQLQSRYRQGRTLELTNRWRMVVPAFAVRCRSDWCRSRFWCRAPNCRWSLPSKLHKEGQNKVKVVFGRIARVLGSGSMTKVPEPRSMITIFLKIAAEPQLTRGRTLRKTGHLKIHLGNKRASEIGIGAHRGTCNRFKTKLEPLRLFITALGDFFSLTGTRADVVSTKPFR